MYQRFGIALALSLCLLSGCARNISPNAYSESHIGEASTTYQGTIMSVRQVTSVGSERLQDNVAGAGLGALAGGLAGGAFGTGYGKLAMAAGGAVAGGVAGAFAEKALKEQQALEYVVKLSNGQIMTIVQGLDSPLAVGQRVLVMVSYDGRSRVVPDYSPTTEVQPIAPSPMVVKRR